MPNLNPTEFQPESKDWLSSNDKELRDYIGAVVSRKAFALGYVFLDSSSSSTLDLKPSSYLIDNTSSLSFTLPYAKGLGQNKAGTLRFITGPNSGTITLNSQLTEGIIGGGAIGGALTLLPGEIWELWSDPVHSNWYAYLQSSYLDVPYTCTVSSGSGTFTTASATASYYRFPASTGVLIQYRIVVTITTNGTAATSLICSLPFAANYGFPAYGSEVNSTLIGVQGFVTGSSVILRKADGTYPGANNTIFSITGMYR